MATFPFPHHNHHHLLLLPSYNKLSASHLLKTTKPISMGAKTAAAGGLCLNRIRPHVRSVRSPQQPDWKPDDHDLGSKKTATVAEAAVGGGRKVMIVVDSSAEAKVALQWALSHTVQTHDSLLLLHVAKPSNNHHDHQGLMKGRGSRGYELVNSLKKMSQMKRPEVEIEALIVEGKEKGPAILEEAKKQDVALLVLGQRKRSSMTWRLIMMWASNKLVNAAGAGAGGVVEYCIQHAECMAIAVRRKSKKHGGYLITTKRHKDFWLLA